MAEASLDYHDRAHTHKGRRRWLLMPAVTLWTAGACQSLRLVYVL